MLACAVQAIRGALMEHTGVEPPELPEPIPVRDYGEVDLTQSALLLEQLSELFPGDGIEAEQPDIMEEYGQSCAPCPPVVPCCAMCTATHCILAKRGAASACRKLIQSRASLQEFVGSLQRRQQQGGRCAASALGRRGTLLEWCPPGVRNKG